MSFTLSFPRTNILFFGGKRNCNYKYFHPSEVRLMGEPSHICYNWQVVNNTKRRVEQALCWPKNRGFNGMQRSAFSLFIHQKEIYGILESNNVFFLKQVACQSWEEQGKTLTVRGMHSQGLIPNGKKVLSCKVYNSRDILQLTLV